MKCGMKTTKLIKMKSVDHTIAVYLGMWIVIVAVLDYFDCERLLQVLNDLLQIGNWYDTNNFDKLGRNITTVHILA